MAMRKAFLGSKIRRLRQERKLTQQHMAAARQQALRPALHPDRPAAHIHIRATS